MRIILNELLVIHICSINLFIFSVSSAFQFIGCRSILEIKIKINNLIQSNILSALLNIFLTACN